MPGRAQSPGPDADAAFLGWQTCYSGELVPLYTITAAGHPAYRSTVSDVTLRRLHLRIPLTPSPYPGQPPTPWHPQETEPHHPRTAREAITEAGLDYTVVVKRFRRITEFPRDSFATVRTDTGDVLGVVGSGYEPVQNRDAFDCFDALVEGHGAMYETAGVFGHGERIWLLARLPGYVKVHRNDLVNKYLLLISSHDGSVPVRVKIMPIRVICTNTLTSALPGLGDFPLHQTRNPAKKLEQAAALLGWSDSAFDQLEVTFNRMAATRATEHQLRHYVQALAPERIEAESDGGTERVRNDLLRLHDSGRGAHLARGTWWGAYNSVTEYTDHRMCNGTVPARLHSIWFGRGEHLKVKAFRLAQQMMEA